MRVVGIGSVRGAPGVTTTSMLVAGTLPGSVALVEADLAGGAIAVRYGLGREPGLTTLAAAGPVDGDGWRAHAQDAGGVAVLVGPDSPDSARALWRRAGDRLGRNLTASDATVVVDLGRVSDDLPLRDEMSLLVVLVRPVAEHLVTLSHRLPALRRQVRQVGVVLVGDGNYRPADVADPLGVDVLGVLPHDARAAEALCGDGRSVNLTRSRLFRATSAVAATIEAAVAPSDAPVGSVP